MYQDRDSLSLDNPPNTPPYASGSRISTDRKAELEEFLRRRRIPDVVAVPDIIGGFLVRGKLVTPETIFSQKDELEGNQRIAPLLYMEARDGLWCPGLEAKGIPRHGLSLKWKGNIQVPVADIHHLVKYKDAQGKVRKLHMARYLRMVCHDHNAEYGEPVVYPLEVVRSLGGVPLGFVGSASAPERESASAAHEPRGEWTSEEGKRSDKMTYRYRQKLYHPETGLKEGDTRAVKRFAAELADEFGIGQPQTYQRYLENDALAGYFKLFDEDGVDKVERLRKPYPLARLGIMTKADRQPMPPDHPTVPTSPTEPPVPKVENQP